MNLSAQIFSAAVAALLCGIPVAGADGGNAPPVQPAAPSLPMNQDDAATEYPDVKPPNRAAFLRPGEVLVFRLSWGIFSNAGELRIETTQEETPETGRRIRVKIHTKSKGLISAVFPVNSDASSYIDPATGRPLLIERSGKEGDKEVHTTTVYDYATHRVTHTDHNKAKRSGEADLPDEPAYDTFVVMMLARTWNLQPAGTRRVLSSFEDDIYELEATALKEDKIKVYAGRFDVVEIELKQVGELKGFFKKGGTMRFFISKGEDPQIVRIELRAGAGTFVMQLEKVEQNEAATPSGPASQ